MLTTLFITSILSICSISICNTIEWSKKTLVEQHPNILECGYNECSFSSVYDDETKSWFSLEKDGVQRHFPHSDDSVPAIIYYVSDTSVFNPSLTWDYNMPDNILGGIVKQNFLNSILKWNNVFFYQNSSNQIITKKKLVDIIPGTYANRNVLIHPEKTIYMQKLDSAAETRPNGTPSFDVVQNSIEHKHYDYWDIALNLEAYGVNFYNNNPVDRYGAHEFGHVLGLRDIDTVEGCGDHHAELLMGYASPRQSEITYKDLVGVAITRGLHTDSDHSWIYDYISSTDNDCRLICSICNCVKHVTSLTGYNYVLFKLCQNDHTLSGGNMFAVASYGTKDYYKCKYCQYVEPVTNLVNQNYIVTNHFDSTYHMVTNQVNGLSYSFLDLHTFDNNGVCTGCSQTTPHSYTYNYVIHNLFYHKSYCTCGEYALMSHVADASHIFSSGGHFFAPCLYCGATINLGGDGPIIPTPDPSCQNQQMVSNNGSYIMPNGIYVIVEEDLQLYFNGTLEFHFVEDVVD